jgi:uncharacterized protein YjbJ (UPF0337 family)
MDEESCILSTISAMSLMLVFYSGNGKEKWAKIHAERAKNELEGTADNLASQAKVKVQDAVQEVKKTVS